MKKRLIGIVLLSLVLIPTSIRPTIAQTPAQVTPSVPFYESAACQFPIPDGETVACGYLTVPENRQVANPAAKTIRLHIAHFKSHTPNPPADPIVYLVGGPGVSLLYDIKTIFYHFSFYLDNRDVIVIDQRGTGYSEPALTCVDAVNRRLNYRTQLRQCYNYLTNDLDADLRAYNSIENAADVEDLRLALGIQEWNVVGTSYGARLALYLMRDYPEGIRSVILDSVAPPHIQRSLDIRDDINARQLQQLFADCLQETLCALAYGDIQATYNRVLDTLRRQPIEAEAPDGYMVRVDDEAFRAYLYGMMATTKEAYQIPLVIDAAANGDIGRILTYISSEYTVFDGMMRAMNCNDGDGLFMQEVCNAWRLNGDAPPPVTSDLPTLVVMGTYDTLTPPVWGDSTADNLPNSTFLVFPYTGHGVVRSGGTCPQTIAFAFLDNPQAEVDARCIEQMEPAFTLEQIMMFAPQ